MNKAKTTLDAIRIALGMEVEEVKLASMKLDDGVTVLEADSFEAGQSVNIKTEDEQLIALPVGEYTLEDGMMLVVSEEGIIESIGEKPAEEEVEVEEEVAASNAPTETVATPKKVIEAVTKESHFSAEEKDNFLEAIAKVVDAKLESFKAELSKEDESEEIETIVHNPEKVEMSKAPKGLVAFLNNRK